MPEKAIRAAYIKRETSNHNRQDFLNGPVKDCVSQSYTNRFKTKR